ncbi:MAG: hypothetical protein JWQ38_801 [Flavipsychrobacter sp.]|nr:hypothetical protein [Flavipsychrobacter sp.]
MLLPIVYYLANCKCQEISPLRKLAVPDLLHCEMTDFDGACLYFNT